MHCLSEFIKRNALSYCLNRQDRLGQKLGTQIGILYYYPIKLVGPAGFEPAAYGSLQLQTTHHPFVR